MTNEWASACLDITGHNCITIRCKNKSITISKNEWDLLREYREEITEALNTKTEKTWVNKHGAGKMYTSLFKGKNYFHIRVFWNDKVPSPEGVGLSLKNWNTICAKYMDNDKWGERAISIYGEMVSCIVERKIKEELATRPEVVISDYMYKLEDLFDDSYDEVQPSAFIMKLAIVCGTENDILEETFERYLATKFLKKEFVFKKFKGFITDFLEYMKEEKDDDSTKN